MPDEILPGRTMTGCDTQNKFLSGSVGSNPTDCVKLFYLQPRSFLFRILLLGRKYNVSIVGSVVECSPATRAARVRFPDDATFCSELRSFIDFV